MSLGNNNNNNNLVKFCSDCAPPNCFETPATHEHSHKSTCKTNANQFEISGENYDPTRRSKHGISSHPNSCPNANEFSDRAPEMSKKESNELVSLDRLADEIAQGFGSETTFDYVDEFSADRINKSAGEVGILGSYLDDSVRHFVVYDSVLTDQLNESISTSSFYCDDTSFERDRDLIFSTSSRHRSLSPSWARSRNDSFRVDSNSADLDLDVFPSLGGTPRGRRIPRFYGQRHSTPLKNRDSSGVSSFEDTFAGDNHSDEDDDITESYLDTVWIGSSAWKLPGCNLLVKHQKDLQKDELSNSMICRLDDDNILLDECLGIRDAIYDKAVASDVAEDGWSEKEFGVSLRDEFRVRSSSDDKMLDAQWKRNKTTYKDKLLEGLMMNSTPNKSESSRNLRDRVAESKPTSQSSAKEALPENAAGAKNQDQATGHKKSQNKNAECSAQNSLQMRDGRWSEPKSKKNVPKPAQNASGSKVATSNRANGDPYSKPINTSKEHSKVAEQNTGSPSDVKKALRGGLRSADDRFENSISSSVDEVKVKNCSRLSVQTTKRRKLKKFGSLDLGEFQEDPENKSPKNHRKWKSRDDLHGAAPNSLKVDNYILWPILGFVVFAGFVAFCFREKISFMIASKFPFERPPI